MAVLREFNAGRFERLSSYDQTTLLLAGEKAVPLESIPVRTGKLSWSPKSGLRFPHLFTAVTRSLLDPESELNPPVQVCGFTIAVSQAE